MCDQASIRPGFPGSVLPSFAVWPWPGPFPSLNLFFKYNKESSVAKYKEDWFESNRQGVKLPLEHLLLLVLWGSPFSLSV